MRKWTTEKDLDDAPMFAVFKGLEGKCDGRDLTERQWNLFHVGFSYGADVENELRRRKISPLPFEPEKDEDEAPASTTDMDAALEFLNEGGALVKVPDAMGSEYCRYYALRPLPDRHKYIEVHYNPGDEVEYSDSMDTISTCDARNRHVEALVQEQKERDKKLGLIIKKG